MSKIKKRNLSDTAVSNKRAKEPGLYNSEVCSICNKRIEERSARNKGEDAVFCEGKCQKWLHRHCAGLSQPCFKLINETDAPFTCVYCLLIQQAAQINEMHTTVKNLTTQIDTILSKQTSESQLNPSKQTNEHMELSVNTTNTVVTEK